MEKLSFWTYLNIIAGSVCMLYWLLDYPNIYFLMGVANLYIARDVIRKGSDK